MRFWKKSLMARLVISFLLLSLLSVSLVAYIAYLRAKDALTQSAFDQLDAVATLKEDELNRWVQDHRQLVVWLSALPDIQYQAQILLSLDESDLQYQSAYGFLARYLASMAAGNPELQEIFILTNVGGKIALSTDSAHEGDYRVADRYFTQGRLDTFVQSVYPSPVLGKPTMTIATPLRDESGQQTGVLAAHLNLERMDRIISERTGLGTTGETYLVDQLNLFVTGERFGRDEFPRGIHSEGIEAAVQGISDQGLYRNYAGVPVVGVYRWVEEQKLALLAEMSQQEAFAPARRLAGTIILVGLASAGVLVVGVYLLARQIARPVLAITETARQVTAGDLSRTAPVMTEDEIGVLANAFNAMQAGLRQSRLQLEQYARTLEQRVSERTAELEQANTALSRRAVQLEASSQVGQQITSVLNLDQLLMLVVNLIQDRFGYYFVGVWLLTDAQDFVVLRAGTGQAGQLLREQDFRIPIDTASIVARVCRTGAYRAVDDVSEDAEYLALEELSHTRSELALPLRKGEAVLGVLDIESDQRAAFGPDDHVVLQTLADQIAIAIHNAQLYKAEQHRRQLAESLEQIGRTLSSSLDMRQVPDRILEQLAIVVPYERGSVILQQGDQVRIIAHRGFPDDERVKNLHVSIRKGDVFQQMANSHRPLLVDDVTQEPGWQQVEWLPLQRSFLGVPLISQDRVIGMISLLRRETAAFGPHDATLVLAFAGQAAIVLENARLYDEISRFNQQLEETVRKRTAALQVAYNQLERLDRTKSDFIGIASHELRTPLTVLRGYSQMLLSDPQIKASDYYQQLIAGIHSGAIRMQGVVESMLDVAKIDSRALQLLPEPLFVPALIHQIVYEQLVEPLAERQLKLVVQDMSRLPAIEADPEALHKVFYHLITNAIKYTPDGGTITISGQPLAVGQDELPEGGIEVIVSDTGIGIDPEFQELIFAKFYQTGEIALHSTGKTKFKGGGPGLGLAIARGIIEAHGGALWVESRGCDEETCPGSHFHVVLPIRRRARHKQQDPEA